MAIDIGADAIDRVYALNHATQNKCFIEGSNPATVAGKITKVYLWWKGGIVGETWVGIFYKTDGNTFSSRDQAMVSNQHAVDDGLNEFDVDFDIEIGDYIGVRLLHSAAGYGIALDYDAGWTNDYWRTLATVSLPLTNYTFDNLGKRIISVYGELGKGGMVGLNPALMEALGY